MDKITLSLTAAERKLLCSGIIAEVGYIKRLAATAPDAAPQFTLDELDELHGWIAAEANHCKSRKRQKALDGILRKINKLLEADTNEPAPLRLHDPDRPPVSVANEMADRTEGGLAKTHDNIRDDDKAILEELEVALVQNAHPEREVAIWEWIGGMTGKVMVAMPTAERKIVFHTLVAYSVGALTAAQQADPVVRQIIQIAEGK